MVVHPRCSLALGSEKACPTGTDSAGEPASEQSGTASSQEPASVPGSARNAEETHFRSLSNIPVLVTFVVAFAAWWTAFIGQIIYESKYRQVRGASGSAVGVSWFGVAVSSLYGGATR